MFRNYLVTALRNFARHRLYSFINVAGLAVGLACAMFIILFIRDELSYDKWIPDSANLYRIESTFRFPGRAEDNFAVVPFPVTAALAAHIPDVLAQTRIDPERLTVKVGDRLFSDRTDAVDPNFFSVIKLPLVTGDPATVFANPESVVLSQTAARKYFGSADAMGKIIVMEGGHPLTVTGLMRDLPHNTQIAAEIVFPDTSKADQYPLSGRQEWLQIGVFGYVKLAPGTDPNIVLAKFRPVIDANIDVRKEMSVDLKGSQLFSPHLTPFYDVHLSSEKYGGMTTPGSWTTVYGFAAVATLILLIACFNFTNLATARAMMRAREVSLRKVMGANRRQLIFQFLGEAILVAFVAMILALTIVEILLPLYDRLLDRPIQLNYLGDWPLVAAFVAIALLTGLLSGLYPAFVLSAFRPATMLKTSAAGRSGSGLLRSSLVVLQFAVSIGLGIAALVVFAQIRYAQQLDLGFDRSNVVALDGTDKLTRAARENFVQALNADPAIESAAQSGPYPFGNSIDVETVRAPGAPQSSVLRIFDIGYDFPQLYRVRLLAGRYLSRSMAQDTNTSTKGSGFEEGRNILINNAAARHFGYTAAGALGKTLIVGDAHMTIVGVLNDTNMDGVKTPPTPIIYYNNPANIDSVSIRLKAGQAQEGLSDIDAIWRRFAPQFAVQRHFIDDSFDKMFRADEEQGKMFGIFVGIAVFIACLGLFGLAAFTAERRTREIGVRKVFGARARDIVGLLLWQFSIPVLIANLIAWPVAWYYLHSWLETYAYRIALSPLYFLVAGLVALLIAWGTVIGHAVRVARANPIEALRYE